MNLLHCLDAQIRADCRVLVLGSMPGSASLDAQRYYAHPRNRFWPLIGQLCGLDPMLAYSERLQAAQRCGLGLWDVLAQCRRQGSLDASIVRGSEQVNALDALLPQLPHLAVIACNGGTASRLYQRHLQQRVAAVRPQLQVLTLPSTSPANAGCSLPQLWLHWQVLQPWLAAVGDPGPNAASAHEKGDQT